MGDGIYVATDSFVADIDGETITVHKNVTRVREGHVLLARCGQFFAPIDTGVHFEVEDATATPGGKRGQKTAA